MILSLLGLTNDIFLNVNGSISSRVLTSFSFCLTCDEPIALFTLHSFQKVIYSINLYLLKQKPTIRKIY